MGPIAKYLTIYLSQDYLKFQARVYRKIDLR